MSEWRPISSAPRDGTLIEVMDEDAGRFHMRWNKDGFNQLFSQNHGLWETEGAGLTWTEDDGMGPTYWRPIPATIDDAPSCGQENRH
jgi:hypothetical protein